MKTKSIIISGVASVVLAVGVAFPALAWHPEGEIIKKVQNETTGSSLSDANFVDEAVAASPGDILKYSITISNVAAPAEGQGNDMAFIALTDNLPAGLEIIEGNTSDNYDLITPGNSVTKEFRVKVTSNVDGEVITNTACFEGDSVVKDNPQEGCDDAVVIVEVPEEETPEVPVTETPVEETPEEVTEEQKPVPQPEKLPATGPAAIFGATAGISALTYAGYMFARSKQALINRFK